MRRSLGNLAVLASVFPIARPRLLFVRALKVDLLGRRGRALRLWRRSAAEARQRGMPHDEARATMEIAVRLPDGNARQRLEQHGRGLLAELGVQDWVRLPGVNEAQRERVQPRSAPQAARIISAIWIIMNA